MFYSTRVQNKLCYAPLVVQTKPTLRKQNNRTWKATNRFQINVRFHCKDWSRLLWNNWPKSVYLLPVVIVVLQVPLQTFSCRLHVSFFVLRDPKNRTVHYWLTNNFVKFSSTCFCIKCMQLDTQGDRLNRSRHVSTINKTKTGETTTMWRWILIN